MREDPKATGDFECNGLFSTLEASDYTRST
jgi:hypothetical protein